MSRENMKLIEKFDMKTVLIQQTIETKPLTKDTISKLVGKTTSLGNDLKENDVLYYVMCMDKENGNIVRKMQSLKEEFEFYENNYNWVKYSENSELPELYNKEIKFAST